MSRERNLGLVALIAGCVVLLSSCGGEATTASSASEPSAAVSREAAR